MLKRWRRLDEPGLEIFNVSGDGSGWSARSSLTFGGEPSFGLRYVWTLDSAWQTRSLQLDVTGETERALRIERAGPESWRMDGRARPELDGCVEVDVSATPFCNGLAVRRLKGVAAEITALYVLVPDLSVVGSRQRYEPRGERRWQYIDLGVAKGFEALLEFDDEGFVRRYEGLFEAF
jgi:uncharacterized protein